MKAKHTSNANTKTRREREIKRERERERERVREREIVIKALGALFLPHFGGTFPLSEPLN